MPETTCRRCSDCKGYSHHWLPDLRPYEDENFEPGDYSCKHCPQRGVECPNCTDGAVDIDGDECICARCQGEGVIPMTDEEVFQEMQLWADPQRKAP